VKGLEPAAFFIFAAAVVGLANRRLKDRFVLLFIESLSRLESLMNTKCEDLSGVIVVGRSGGPVRPLATRMLK